MCIAYLSIKKHPEWPLFIAANRDEFHHRKALAAAPWKNKPDLIAGIDCEAGGTWLGLNKNGRFALLTNYRDIHSIMPAAPSRGYLVSEFLLNDMPALDYASTILAKGKQYNAFNLVVGNRDRSIYISNRGLQAQPVELQQGSHVLSNHLMDTPWPKAERLRKALDSIELDFLPDQLPDIFDILRDNTRPPDHDLPNTGLSLERERLLSSPFIVSPDYGTRCSTIIAIHKSGKTLFSERIYNPAGEPVSETKFDFLIQD
ncbi:NRDE family protein [Advenella sp. RU8]|uniref:NRDE family protein n=1 Tax=Advenella sp. RU8 TaxID=3399575 RepID=UPI003AAE073B